MHSANGTNNDLSRTQSQRQGLTSLQIRTDTITGVDHGGWGRDHRENM